MQVIPIITGRGLVTPLGRTAQQTWQSLVAGRFITDHSRVDPVGDQPIPRVAALAIESVDQAMIQAGWSEETDDIAVIACTSKGSVENWMSSNASLSNGFGLCDLSAIVARHIGSIFGPRLTLSAACAGGLHGLIRAAMMIQNGDARRVMVVAAEASVHPLFLASFQRLGVFPPAGELCRPFDLHRSGFLMSDASAAICVEAGPSDRAIAVIDRFALGGDATHLTGSDPHGKVLRYLLKKVIADDPIDLVHAHGTGTVANDNTELAALESIISGDSPTHLYSHKAALGHSLGASGLVSAVITCLCHQTNTVPPNINTAHPMQMQNLHIGGEMKSKTIDRSLIHAAGFGGPTAVVSLARNLAK